MDLSKGLRYNESIEINWNTSSDDLEKLFRDNGIEPEVYYDPQDHIKIVSAPIKFINVGQGYVNFCYKKHYLISVSLPPAREPLPFDLNDYNEIDEKLIEYFGKPKTRKKDKTLWKFGKTVLEHYYETRDDVTTAYLIIDPDRAKNRWIGFWGFFGFL